MVEVRLMENIIERYDIMDEKAKSIIDNYIKNVNEVCHILLSGINKQENLQLKTKWDLFEYISKTHKMEFQIDGITYKLHGRGCFSFANKGFLNWDFGYRSRWCGVDPWMLGMTLQKNSSPYVEYYDGRLLQQACEQAVEDGEMFENRGLYHYTIPLKETFSPNFPKEYNKLIIEYFDDKWILLKNKTIDKFVRKSNRVYNKIYQNENTYMLRFLKNDNEIYSIPYDDICYPENAVKIMTDTIIRNLKNSFVEDASRVTPINLK